MSDSSKSRTSQGNVQSFDRRRFVQTAGAAGVAALAGCNGLGGGGTEEGTDDGSGDGTATDGDSNGSSGDAVTYWTLFSGGDGETMRSMVEEINSSTDVTVDRQRVPFDEYYDRLYTSLTGGEAPDIAVMHRERLVEFQDLVVPLTDQISTDPYVDSIFNRAMVDDQILGVPLDAHPHGLWYNKDIFDEAGLDPESPPTTPDEWESANETIAEETDYTVGQIHAGGLSMAFIRMALRSRGVGVLNEDKTEAGFNNEDGLAVAEYYDRIINEDGWVPQSSDEGWNAWNNGEAAWLIDGTWHLGVVRDLDFDFGLAKPYLMPGSEDPMTAGGSHTLVVPRSQSRSDEVEQQAVDVIRMLTQDYNLQWGSDAGHLPANQSALESDELQSTDTWEQSLSTFYEMATNDKVAYNPRTENNGEWTPEIWQRFNAIRQDDTEPQEAIEAAAQGVNQVL